MKLLPYRKAGQEKPGTLGQDGKFRGLSEVVEGINLNALTRLSSRPCE